MLKYKDLKTAIQKTSKHQQDKVEIKNIEVQEKTEGKEDKPELNADLLEEAMNKLNNKTYIHPECTEVPYDFVKKFKNVVQNKQNNNQNNNQNLNELSIYNIVGLINNKQLTEIPLGSIATRDISILNKFIAKLLHQKENIVAIWCSDIIQKKIITGVDIESFIKEFKYIISKNNVNDKAVSSIAFAVLRHYKPSKYTKTQNKYIYPIEYDHVISQIIDLIDENYQFNDNIDFYLHNLFVTYTGENHYGVKKVGHINLNEQLKKVNLNIK